ncbi:amino acid ABC transporter ATP-binding protein [[Clostridium] scindens]|uniref:amino acid ABC transporter ATP-binding protein n=1 Tax=Clostridium scindens (strain JCM 10418 / VPI 12708) TaxID=29347 RepID=UPI0022E10177|nr:amino acid ABC transporter ATP-binding protein [[Clostridium] scindens]
MAQLINVENISKTFGDKVVLNDLSLTIDKKEVVTLIGSSGCGKSTLVRCIAGLESIQKGKITIDNTEVKNVKSVAGKIGMVFQNFNLFPHYTVLDNVSKPLQTIKKMKKSEADELGRELLKKVHLEDQASQYPSTLSGGQKQRVAIARALAMNPEIMIFDEPTSSLDPELAHEVFETIRDLAEEGQTMIIVTHQINAIKNFATRVVFLSHGKIAAQGDVETMFGKSDNEELNKFLKMVDFDDLKE